MNRDTMVTVTRTTPPATQRGLDPHIQLCRLSSVDLLSADVTVDAPYPLLDLRAILRLDILVSGRFRNAWVLYSKYYPGHNETWMGVSSLFWARRSAGCPHPVNLALVGFSWMRVKQYGGGGVLGNGINICITSLTDARLAAARRKKLKNVSVII